MGIKVYGGGEEKTSETAGSIKEKLGLTADPTANKFLRDDGTLQEVGASKSTLQTILDYDLSADTGEISFVLCNKFINSLHTGNDLNIFSVFIDCLNLGSFSAKIYNLDNELLDTITQNSNTLLQIQISDYSTAIVNDAIVIKVVIAPTTVENYITKILFLKKAGITKAAYNLNSNYNYTMASHLTNFLGLLWFRLYNDIAVTTMVNMFGSCYNLQSVTLPTSLNSVTTMQNMFNSCYNLQSVTLPTSLNAVTTMTGMFGSCYNLQSITLPTSLNAITTMQSMFSNCYNLQSITLPTSLNAITTMASMFSACYNLQSVTLPTSLNAITTMASMFDNCSNLQSVTLPTSLNAITTMTSMFSNCLNLQTITNNPTFNTAQIDATTAFSLCYKLTAINLNFKASKLLVGSDTTNLYKTAITSIDINWAGSTYGGSSPQIDIRYNSLDATELNRIFTALPTVTSKTINVVGNPGAATCNPTIATAKNWTVTTT